MAKKRGKRLEQLIVDTLRAMVITDPLFLQSWGRYKTPFSGTDPQDIPDLAFVQGLVGSAAIVGAQFDQSDLLDPLSDGNWQLPFAPPADNTPFVVRVDYDYTGSGGTVGYKNLFPSFDNDIIFGFEDPALGTQTIRVFATNIIINPPVPAPLPVFTLQPDAGATIVQTDTLILTTTVTGAVTYQWFKDGVYVPGQIGTTLNVFNFGASDAGTYVLRAYNVDGAYTDSTSSVITYDSGRAVVNRSAMKSDFSPNGVGRQIEVNDGTSTKTINAGAIGYFLTSATTFDIKQAGVDSLTVKDGFNTFSPALGGSVSNIYNSPFFGPIYTYNDN